MSHAALLSGMALANSGLGMAHGVAAALGVHLRVSHGLACAVMLPIALEANRACCESQLAELAAAAGLVSDTSTRYATDVLLATIDEISHRIGVPRRLADLGVRRSIFLTWCAIPVAIAWTAIRGLTDEELTRLLEAHL